MSKVYFTPVHYSHFYQKELKYNVSLHVTERVAEEVISLPIYPGMQDTEVETVIKEIKDFYYEEKY
jgi:perosamine synthetase